MDRMERTGSALMRLFVGGIVLAGLAVTGCREDEQDRVLLFEKGTYLGRPDQALSDEQADLLRQRGAGQKF